MKKPTLIILVILAVAAALVASFLVYRSTLGGSELSSARSRWQTANIAHYRYNLNVSCFCAFVERMPLAIEVQDGRVLSMQYKDGTPVSAEERQMFASYETLDKLFDFTAESQQKADSIKIAYDSTYGFPSSVEIDFIQQAADDELYLYVTGFQQLP